MVGVVGGATMNASSSDYGGLMAGGAGWWYMCWEFSDPSSVESYGLRPSELSVILVSHDHRDIACVFE